MQVASVSELMFLGVWGAGILDFEAQFTSRKALLGGRILSALGWSGSLKVNGGRTTGNAKVAEHHVDQQLRVFTRLMIDEWAICKNPHLLFAYE